MDCEPIDEEKRESERARERASERERERAREQESKRERERETARAREQESERARESNREIRGGVSDSERRCSGDVPEARTFKGIAGAFKQRMCFILVFGKRFGFSETSRNPTAFF